jgi:hypothetical protein
MMEKVGRGKTKMDKMARREGLPCVRRSRTLFKSEMVPFECKDKSNDDGNVKVMTKGTRSEEIQKMENQSLSATCGV